MSKVIVRRSSISNIIISEGSEEERKKKHEEIKSLAIQYRGIVLQDEPCGNEIFLSVSFGKEENRRLWEETIEAV